MKLTEDQKAEMERILREQADPNRKSPMVEFWEYLDRRNAERRAALDTTS